MQEARHRQTNGEHAQRGGFRDRICEREVRAVIREVAVAVDRVSQGVGLEVR
jgi:hypothetical protein